MQRAVMRPMGLVPVDLSDDGANFLRTKFVKKFIVKEKRIK